MPRSRSHRRGCGSGEIGRRRRGIGHRRCQDAEFDEFLDGATDDEFIEETIEAFAVEFERTGAAADRIGVGKMIDDAPPGGSRGVVALIDIEQTEGIGTIAAETAGDGVD